MTSLVLAPGHAIVRDVEKVDCDAGWHLKAFQAGEGPLYVEHVGYAVRLAAEDSQSLLVFSGGQTDSAAGRRSEAEGYLEIAGRNGWHGFPEVRDRAATEEFALDSFQNLLYGICRFRECAGRFPDSIRVVGWRFKQERFEFHWHSLRIPAARFEYRGVNDPADLKLAMRHEAETLRLYRENPYGNSGLLAAKRTARNPFGRYPDYRRTCPELGEILKRQGRELPPVLG